VGSAACSATLTLTVNPGVQSIALANQSVAAGTTVTLDATGYAGTGGVTYQVDGGTASDCAIANGDQLTALGAGTCLVSATIAPDDDYAGATSSDATITFNLVSQSIVLHGGTVPTGTTVTLVAKGYLGTGPVTYTITFHTVTPKVVSPARTISIVPFSEGSYMLSSALDADIMNLAKVIRSGQYKAVDLTGYTDNVFTPAFNVTLNQDRANAVALQLTSDLSTLHYPGVAITIVTTPAFAAFHADSNTTAAGRAYNRRVVATLKAT
jgi:outer membrane protein OmpA-like peptidoglycan-associated protein